VNIQTLYVLIPHHPRSGRKTDPFRYYLLETEQRWKKEQPFYEIYEKQREGLKTLLKKLA
jgi:hypothetical protein